MASQRTIGQLTLPSEWWRQAALALVIEANSKSVPTASTGEMPMPEMRNGVISEPAPTPVRPTRKPTAKPPKTMMGQAPECRNSI